MNTNTLPSEQAAVVGVVDPDVLTATTHSTGWIDMSRFEHVMAVVMAGTLGTSATLDAKFEQDITGGGGDAEDIAGKAITTLTQAGTDSDKQAIINLRGSELSEGFRYARLTLTVAEASSDGGAVVLGFGPKNAPASLADLASVDEIIA